MSTRFFLIMGHRTPEEAHEHVETNHGKVVDSKLLPSPAGEMVYGVVEFERYEMHSIKKIAQARTEKKWLMWAGDTSIIFTPDELEKIQSEGSFCHGDNFILVDPQGLLDGIERSIEEKQKERAVLRARMGLPVERRDLKSLYLGIIGLLARSSVHLSPTADSEEIRDLIQSALEDAAVALPNLKWKRLFNAFDVEVG